MIRFASTRPVLLGLASLAITMTAAMAADDSTFADSPPARSLPFNAGLRNTGFGPFTIKVEIEGVTQGVFSSVEGLVSASEVEPPQENGVREQSPGPIKGTRLILKRPYDPMLSGLWHWRQAGIDGVPMRRDGHIFIFNSGGQLAAHWVFHAGWPCRWEVPALLAGTSVPAEEIVEIVHTGLTLEPPTGS